MATVIPIKLSRVAGNVLRVIALYPPVPAFQPYFATSGSTNDGATVLPGDPVFPNPRNYTRDESAVSFGFPFSVDSDDIQVPDQQGVYSLPLNTYAWVAPSYLLNQPPGPGDTYSILLLDVDAAPVQPGFSALRVDYVDNSGNAQVDYLDMPFYPKWDNHPSLIEQIAEYERQAFAFEQREIDVLNHDIREVINRMLLKGLNASGTLFATQATVGLQPAVQAHSMPVAVAAKLFEVFDGLQAAKNAPRVYEKATYGISSVSSATVSPGDTIVVTLTENVHAGDNVYLHGFPLNGVVSGATITATIPTSLNTSATLDLWVGQNGFNFTGSVDITIVPLPRVDSMSTSRGRIGIANDQFTITGANFASQTGTVTFNGGATALITTWTDNEIIGLVPTNAISGPIAVTTYLDKSAHAALVILPSSSLQALKITPQLNLIQAGQSVTFQAQFNSNPVNVDWSLIDDTGNVGRGSIAHGFITTDGTYTAPASSVLNAPFSLTVLATYYGANGNATASSSLVVVPESGTLTISPSAVMLEPSFTTRFELLNAGTPVTQGVLWYVNGILEGNETVGTISTSGLYQAPARVPVNATVHIEAVFLNDSAVATVSLVPTGTLSGSNVQHVTYDYTCYPGQTITIGGEDTVNDNAPDCSGYTTPAIQWTAPNSPGVYYVKDTGGQQCYLVTMPGPPPNTWDVTYICRFKTYDKTYSVNVVPPPPPAPTLTSVTSACPGQQVTVSGTHFPADAQVYFAGSNQNLPTASAPSTADGVNYVMSVTIPSNIPTTAASYQIYMSGSTGTSNQIALSIPSSCAAPTPQTLSITPVNPSTEIGTTLPFTATLTYSDGSTKDVTNAVAWYVQNTQGGNSTYGTINTAGTYSAPSSVPATNPVLVQASYVSQNQPMTASSNVAVTSPPPAPPPISPPVVHQGCYMLLVSPNYADVAVPGPQVQFTAVMYIDDANPQNVAAQWSVNGIAGGNAIYGTIDGNGLYTPPANYVPSDFQHIKVTANYTAYPPAPDSPLPLEGYAVLSFYQTIPQTSQCKVDVVSQINIDFGDGRNGYIPVGTTIFMSPGEYLYAQYTEKLDNYTLLPVSNSTPQQLNLLTYTATGQPSEMTYNIYNEGTLSTVGGGLSHAYTVCLGVCDPVSGQFNSLWDFIKVQSPADDDISVQAQTCTVAHDHGEPTFSIIDYISEMAAVAKPVETAPLVKRLQSIWTGTVVFTGQSLSVKNPIKLLQIDLDKNEFEVAFTSRKKKIAVSQNSILIARQKEGAYVLEVEALNANFTPDSNTFVLGVVLDKFYSAWPFLQVEDFEQITESNFSGDSGSIRIGEALMQWGTASNGSVKFELPYETAYTVKGNVNVVNQTLEGFDFTIIDKDSSAVWFTVGS